MFLWLLTFYQAGPNGLFIFYQVFNLILQSAKEKLRELLLSLAKQVSLPNRNKSSSLPNLFPITFV